MSSEYRLLSFTDADLVSDDGLSFYRDPNIGGHVVSFSCAYQGKAINEIMFSDLKDLLRRKGRTREAAVTAAQAYVECAVEHAKYVRVPYGKHRGAMIGQCTDRWDLEWYWKMSHTRREFPLFGRALCAYLGLSEDDPAYGETAMHYSPPSGGLLNRTSRAFDGSDFPLDDLYSFMNMVAMGSDRRAAEAAASAASATAAPGPAVRTPASGSGLATSASGSSLATSAAAKARTDSGKSTTKSANATTRLDRPPLTANAKITSWKPKAKASALAAASASAAKAARKASIAIRRGSGSAKPKLDADGGRGMKATGGGTTVELQDGRGSAKGKRRTGDSVINRAKVQEGPMDKYLVRK
ncbi:hypothetical protein BD626DRAFT_636014 [Schizophyllum amplum]|uniref:Uncharacterized protein n=1 Tax=Schizophyllum amplum TaxID=97359 RepID=A0A550BUH0_9AGAR|nr:hypothetical protein BD626DRAFT_636014 [Auriculariopsis ampla]